MSQIFIFDFTANPKFAASNWRQHQQKFDAGRQLVLHAVEEF